MEGRWKDIEGRWKKYGRPTERRQIEGWKMEEIGKADGRQMERQLRKDGRQMIAVGAAKYFGEMDSGVFYKSPPKISTDHERT